MTGRAVRIALLLLGFTFSLPPPSGWADGSVPYRHYTAQDGLPHETVRSLAQGPDGRLWIGTEAGLAVYDGHEFRPVALPDSLGSASVVDLLVRSSGTTWAALRGTGMVSLHDGRVQQVFPPPKKTNKVIRLLARHDTLLAVTTKSLWVLPPGADAFEKHPYDYPVQTGRGGNPGPREGRGVVDADWAPDRTLWILDGRRGPGRLSLDGSVQFLDAPLTRVFSRAWKGLAVGSSGAILLTGQEEGLRLDPSSGHRTPVATRGYGEALAQGNALYALGSDRIVRWTPSVKRTLSPALGLPKTTYWTAFEDEAGGLWLGSQEGLLHLPAPGVRHVDRIDGAKLRWMTSLGIDSTRNELWAASWGQGLFRLSPRSLHRIPGTSPHWGLKVEGRDGFLHGLSQDGWFRREAGRWRLVHSSVVANEGVVRRTGTGYFRTDEGVIRVRPNRHAIPDTLWHWPREERGYHALTLAPNGDVLLRSHAVLLRFAPDAPHAADTVATFPKYRNVGGWRMVVQDGAAWILLRRKGLLRVGVQTPASTAELVVSAPSEKNLSTSGDSLLLFGANDGLYVVDSQTGRLRRRVTTTDGLASNVARAAQLYRDTLYVAHDNGLSKLPGSVLDETRSPPTALLTGWSVENTPQPLADSSRLAADQRTVSFDFTGVHLTRGSEVRYAYRLVPYDTTWAETRQSFTRYTNLQPGTYRFEVRARLEDGPVSPATAMTFTIPPAYYETAWFRLLLALALLSLIGGAYLWRTQTLRRRQEKLQRLVDERTEKLVEKKKKTEAQAKRLEALDEEKNRFFANVSHELRTPLTILLGSLQDLLDGAFGEISVPVREQLEIMQSNVERLRRLTDQLLDLARLETTEPALEPEPRDLVGLLRRVTRRFVPMAERRGLRLDLETELDAHPCRFDPEKVEKIASNLVSNAVKNTPEGGTVTVRLAVEDDAPPEAVLRVTDTGPGIPPDQQDGIFERFARADNEDSAEKGTGLGLALAREYAELHDGTIEVSSTPGEGSTFTVRLPLPRVAPDAVDAPGAASPAPADDGVPGEGADRPVLLVVEDNEDVRAYLRRHLTDDYHLIEATDGTAGLSKARDADPDLILTDLMMPGMGGIELCRHVREDEDLGSTPVVLLTARAAEEDAVAGLEAGADAYVTKPFSIEELKARLARLLEAHWAGVPGEGSARLRSPEVEATPDDEAFLDRVAEGIDEHLSRADFTVEDLAAEVGLSPRQLERKLKQLTGTTPAAFIRRYRLDAAAQLLEADAGTVSEIAYRVGFGTPETFSTHFKERFGCPPSEYPDAA